MTQLRVDPYQQLRDAFQSTQLPTSGVFLDQLLALRPSSMELSSAQRRSEKGAASESRRLEREFFRAGKGEEWEKYLESGGAATGITGNIDYALEDVVSPVFDLLSIGQYTTAGAIQEMMRTGSAWEGLKQAGRELANSLPGVEWEGARRPSYRDIFEDREASRWATLVGGTVLDILADPINFVPVGALAKGARKVGGTLYEASGPLGRSFARKFMHRYEISRKYPSFLQHERKLLARGENIPYEVEQQMDALLGTLTPNEMILLGAYRDSGRLPIVLKNWASSGAIDPERIPALLKMGEDIGNHANLEFDELVKHGFIHPAMQRLGYLFHSEATKGTRQWRAQRKLMRERFPWKEEALERGAMPPSVSTSGGLAPGKLPATMERTFETTEGRLLATMNDPEFLRTTDLNVRSVMTKRSVAQARQVAFRHFLTDILGDKNISAPITEVALGAAPFSAPGEIFSNASRWGRAKEELLKKWGPQGYGIYEVTKMGKDGSMDVVGAYRVAQPVLDVVTRADKSFHGMDEVSEFWSIIEEWTNVWKGWATFGTAYNMRNMISSGVMSWQAGVGSRYMPGDIIKGSLLNPGGFGLKYLQGLKAQMYATRAGKMPPKAKAAVDSIMEKLGIRDWDSIPMPKVHNDEGKLLKSWEDIARLGEDWGVPQTATRVYDLPRDVERQIWEDLELTVPMGAKAAPELEALSRMSGQGLGPSVGGRVRTIVGNDNPLLKVNRAWAQIAENQARWATWFDRLEKNASPYEAAMSVKTVHYDYRYLTDFEKRWMRNFLPFYAWSRFNLPRQIVAMLEDPGRYAKIPKLYAALESLAPEGWNSIPTPDYFDEVQALQTGQIVRDRPLFLQLDLPHMDLNRLNLKDLQSSMHPLTRVFEFMPRSGYSAFKEAPIENFPGERSEGVPFISKRTEAKIEAIAPPLGKVTRGARASARGELPEYIVSELVGVKLRTVDVRRVMRARTLRKRTLAREFKKRLAQDAGMGL